jgi:diguanylate cyclase (GGDEF)-like protein/PAS domain S-box-containing protein
VTNDLGLLRDAIANLPDGIAIWDGQDSLVACNPAYARLYGAGRATQSLAGMSYRAVAANAFYVERVAPEYAQRHQEWIEERVRQRISAEPRQFQARDGRWWRRATQRMAAGGWVEIVSEITELKRVEDAYRMVLAEENLVLDTLPVGVAFVERHVIMRCNRRLEDMLGYGAGELHGKSTQVWFRDEARWLAARTETYARLRGVGTMEGEARVRRKDGSGLWVHALARALDVAEPEHATVIFAFADVDERYAAEKALAASEATYRALVETSGELIWSLDLEGRWTYLNAAAARFYGREPAQLLGRPLAEFVSHELRERDEAVFRRILAGEPVFDHETRHLRSDGGYVDLSFNAIARRDAAGAIVGATGTARDVTERKRAAAALHESIEKLRLAVETANLKYWEWEAASDTLKWGRNPEGAAQRATKWEEYAAAAVHPEDRERYLAAGRDAIASGEPIDTEFRIVAADGRVLWFSARGVPMLDADGRAHRMIGVAQDITERKQREEEVRFLAYHDSLTGLPNRRLLDDRLKQALYSAQRRSRKLAAMLIDLDDFKKVNDSAGHRAGDAVLRGVAQRLGGCIRKADTLARQGGDEFVIVQSDPHDAADCEVVAQKVLRALAAPFEVEGASYRLGASIGIALFPSAGADADALLRAADAAMYRAKERGGNTFEFAG